MHPYDGGIYCTSVDNDSMFNNCQIGEQDENISKFL